VRAHQTAVALADVLDRRDVLELVRHEERECDDRLRRARIVSLLGRRFVGA
jgi:hypothetical protein